MDLLQEISNRLRAETDRIFDKVTGKVSGLFYDATWGLLKQYQQKAIDLARITLANVYLETLRIARRHIILLCLLIFGTMVSAVAVVAIPVAIVLLTPWSAGIKAVCLLVLGSTYVAGTAWIFLALFSEKHWLKLSGMQELLDRISSSNGRF